MADNQTSIFDTAINTFKSSEYDWELFVDGASKGNPGPSGAGVYIKKQGKDFLRKGFYLQTKTNNEAEYLALVIGILFLKLEVQPGDRVCITSDSELLVKQMLGQYKVRKEELKKFHSVASQESSLFSPTFKHTLRENNTHADALANEGVAQRTSLPIKFLDVLRTYDVYI
ncbi:MAG: ribonuclease HI [Alteromonas naphthalenivorans]|jgi:ribonuclease HI